MGQSGSTVTMSDFLAEVPSWKTGPWYQRLAHRFAMQSKDNLSIVPERRGSGLYLVRIKLLKWATRGLFKGRDFPRTLLGIYIHRFYRGDDDSALHDHQWPSISIVLSGGYWERTQFGVVWRKPGSIRLRGRRSFHQVELDAKRSRGKPVWTLFIVGPHSTDKTWGFIAHGLRKWERWCSYLGLSKEQVGDDSC